MQSRIETISSKFLIGKHIRMTMAGDRTGMLFGSFMPFRKDIQHKANADFYAVMVYDSADFSSFTADTPYEKWAAVEVTKAEAVPEGMDVLELPAGMYAVFTYKGSVEQAQESINYIFNTWLPQSDYQTDHRPHFALMGEKYKNTGPDSEEEFWIPVKAKA